MAALMMDTSSFFDGVLWPPLASRTERAAAGRAQRETHSLESHAELVTPGRANPLSILRSQDARRVSELVPIRYGRMLATPFAYLRGSAGVMAADLAASGRVNLEVQLCGDAHLSNFGLFATSDRRLVFDINDFDETLRGPFDWDVKRLAASCVVAARENKFDVKQCLKVARVAVRAYRTTMIEASLMDPLDLFYVRFDADEILSSIKNEKERERSIKHVRRKSSHKNSLGALLKLTEVQDGRSVIVSQPPLIVPLTGHERRTEGERIRALFDEYLKTMAPDRQALINRYSLTDIALKVVGVGSVGTNCFIALFESGDREPLFLQLKEATESVLEKHLGATSCRQAGQRVVTGQRLIQAATDAFLGWGRYTAPGEQPTDFYVRQLWDGKYSFEVNRLTPKGLRDYARWCGTALARAHARSGDAAMIAGYLGDDATFDRAVTAFAEMYADLAEADHAELVAAADDGALKVVRDL